MSYYAVIDTNIVVSSMLRLLSIPGKIIDYAISGKIILLLALLKSTKIYDLYSFLANCSTIVDLPVLLAPSIKRAFSPLHCFFQFRILWYISLFISISAPTPQQYAN